MSCVPELEPDGSTVAQSIRMLKEVIDGDTYETVAARFGVSRTAVERRIKAIAVQLSQVADIDGLNEDGAAFVRRLRLHRDAILTALVDFDPRKTVEHRSSRIVSMDEIIQAGKRIKGRSNRAWHDLSLFYLLFATGARPLEIARLEVRDYLNSDGSVRRHSQMRAEVAITGKARPLHFASTRLDESLSNYLEERLRLGLGLGRDGAYRGLDPDSRLFLSTAGEGFKITPYGAPGQRRFLCRPILETYRKLFPRNLVVKGLMIAADAIRAADLGGEGVLVSNHGGRQLDQAPGSLDVLPAMKQAVGDRMTIMLDSGVRRGADIVIALCLGAQFVTFGRPTLYGAVAGGLDGVKMAIDIFRTEIDLVMGQIGCPSLDQLGPDFLWQDERGRNR